MKTTAKQLQTPATTPETTPTTSTIPRPSDGRLEDILALVARAGQQSQPKHPEVNAGVVIDQPASASVTSASVTSAPEDGGSIPNAGSSSLKLAWLTTEYPKASHTFVRRELEAVEQSGHSVERFSIRPGGPIADPADVREASKTHYLLQQSLLTHAICVLSLLLKRPVRVLQAVIASWAMWKVSNRGFVRHAAYFVEACTLCVLLQRKQVQHVHVHFGKNAADVARLSFILGGPGYSMQIHGPGEFDNPAGFSLGPKVADSRFTTAITSYATAQLRRWTEQQYWHKLKVIRCGVNDVFLNAGSLLTKDVPQFVCVGRLTAQKGQLLLLESIAQVVRAWRPDVRLVLAGDGEMRNVIEARIHELGIEQQVSISGWIGEHQVRDLIMQSRAMILPSFAEGLPVAIMESFALRRPVISSCITGVPELVEQHKNGWLVIAGDANGTAAAILDCLQTPLDRINEMGQHGRSRVVANHDVRVEASRLVELFQQHVVVDQKHVS